MVKCRFNSRPDDWDGLILAQKTMDATIKQSIKDELKTRSYRTDRTIVVFTKAEFTLFSSGEPEETQLFDTNTKPQRKDPPNQKTKKQQYYSLTLKPQGKHQSRQKREHKIFFFNTLLQTTNKQRSKHTAKKATANTFKAGSSNTIQQQTYAFLLFSTKPALFAA